MVRCGHVRIRPVKVRSSVGKAMSGVVSVKQRAVAVCSVSVKPSLVLSCQVAERCCLVTSCDVWVQFGRVLSRSDL